MNNKEKQVKNTLIYMVPVVISNALPLVALPVFTRILTKEDFGVLALAQIYAIFASGLANFGMTAAYDRNYFQYRKNDQKTAQLIYSIIFFVFTNFIILASITYFFQERMTSLVVGSNQYGNLLFYTFCGHFSFNASYYYLAFFKNSGFATHFSVYTIAINLVNFLVSIFLIAYVRTGIIGLVYAQLCSGVIIFTVLSLVFIKRLKPDISWQIFIESFKISYPLTPRIFFGVINSQFDKYMIGLMNSTGGVGVYSIGQRVANVIFIFMTAIQNVFSPQSYKKMFQNEKIDDGSLGRYLTPFAYVVILLAGLISLLSEEIFFILTPPSYHGSIDIVIILSMFYGFMFFGKLNGNQLIFKKKTYITSVLTVVSITINVGLNIPFIYKWGVIGAAWATLLAGLVSGAVSFAVSQHYYHIKWEYGKMAMIFGLFFTSALTLLLLRHFHVGYEARLLVKMVLFNLYFILGINLQILTKDNALLVVNTLRHFKSVA